MKGLRRKDWNLFEGSCLLRSEAEHKKRWKTLIQGEHKSFPDHIHLLQENYVEYKYIFFYRYLTFWRRIFLFKF